jgi:hypothetical protein
MALNGFVMQEVSNIVLLNLTPISRDGIGQIAIRGG